MRRMEVFLLLAGFSAGMAWAGAPPEVRVEVPQRAGGVAVAGQMVEPGLYCIQMAITPFEETQGHPEWAITGIEVYAEPSHTLLAAYSEPSGPPYPPARVRAEGPLGTSVPLLCTREPLPPGDDRVALTVLTGAGPRPLGVVSTNPLDFSVSVTLAPDPKMPPLEFCCVCGSCKQCESAYIHCICYCPDCHISCHN